MKEVKAKRGRPKGSKNIKKDKARKSRASSIERIYKVINLVQVNRKKIKVIVVNKDLPTVENIMKDAGVNWEIKKQSETVIVNILPGPESPETKSDELGDDFFNDNFSS